MTRNYPELRESVRERVLSNGLRVCYIPKDGFSKTFAILATDFGSVDASFTFEGQRFDTPAGVAHFLEHKMFEDEDGNALQKFARTGASPNAGDPHGRGHSELAGLLRPVPGALPRASRARVYSRQRGEHRAYHARAALHLPSRVLQPEEHGARRVRHGGFRAGLPHGGAAFPGGRPGNR